MGYSKIGHEEATIRTQKGTFMTYDNGLTWEMVSEDTKQLSASLNGIDVIADETGVYYLDNNNEEEIRYIKALESPDAEKISVADPSYMYVDRPATGKNCAENVYGEDAEISYENYLKKDKKFFVLVTKTAIYTSYDGKVWHMETNGRFDEVLTKDYKCIGSTGCYNILNEEYLHQKEVIVTQDTTDEELNNYLLFALNKIYLPTISYYTTGLTHFLEGKNYITENDESNFAMSGENIYTFSDFSTLIDWKADVGMFPFDGITLADLIDTDVATQNDSTFVIEDNEKIAYAINYVTKFYNKQKNILLRECSEELSEIEPDENYAERLNNISYGSDQEKINAFEMYRDYVQAAKGGALEVYNKYLEAVHFLDDYRAKKVIRTAIYETVAAVAPRVKALLYETRENAKKYKASMEVNFSKVGWDYDYGLTQSYIKYMKYIHKNFMQMNEDGDKEIIGIASLYYRTEARPVFLENLNEKLVNVNLSKKLEKYYSNYVTEMNDYTSGKTTVIPNLKLPEDLVDVYYKLLRGEIIKYFNSYEFPEFAYSEEYMNLSLEERDRAVKYLKEIYTMFKKRILDYLTYIKNKNPVYPSNIIDASFYSWLENKTSEKPSWVSEFKRLDIELKDLIIYKFIEEEDKI